MNEVRTRLFVTPLLREGDIPLEPGQAHRLLHVLRLSKGDQVLVFDGSSGEWTAEIAELKRDGGRLTLLAKVRQQTASQDIHFVFAPLKQLRLDYVVQKAVEMGVSAIRPVITSRTAATKANAGKMRANAIGAAEQCGLLAVPEVQAAVAFAPLLKAWPQDRKLIFCDESASFSPPLRQLEGVEPGPVAVLAGPEGGFSPDERAALLAKPFVVPISLGPRILRADTAAVAALALVNAVLGDWR